MSLLGPTFSGSSSYQKRRENSKGGPKWVFKKNIKPNRISFSIDVFHNICKLYPFRYKMSTLGLKLLKILDLMDNKYDSIGYQHLELMCNQLQNFLTMMTVPFHVLEIEISDAQFLHWHISSHGKFHYNQEPVIKELRNVLCKTDLFTNVSILFTNVSTLFTNVSILFTNVSILFTNVSILFTNVSILFTNVSILFTNVSILDPL
jgi:hypothetical protein